MPSSWQETSHALKRLNTCHLATFLVHIYWDQTVTSRVNTLWNISLHGGPAKVLNGAGARWARRWTDSTPISQCCWNEQHRPREKITQMTARFVLTSLLLLALFTPPLIPFKEYGRNMSPLGVNGRWLWISYATSFPPQTVYVSLPKTATSVTCS